LIDIYEPGSYEGKTLSKLCHRTLNKKKWTIEEQLIIEDISRQLEGGKLLCRGQEIEGTALEYAVPEQTEAGEKYLYVPIRAIRPKREDSSVSWEEPLIVMRLLRSELELVVKSGFVYVPLLFDPDIAREIRRESDRDEPPSKQPGSAQDLWLNGRAVHSSRL